MDDRMHSLLEFQGWANDRVLEALKNTRQENVRALQLLGHVLTSERIWLLRLQGKDTVGTNKSQELSLSECERMARENQNVLGELLATFGSGGLFSTIDYKNLSGKGFSNTIGDIFTHVVIHGAYHRGQIAASLRAEGIDPPNTDFITFVRECKS